ncbi:MAG: hypothetical protein ACX939_02785 [Hyphococcus sp.]
MKTLIKAATAGLIGLTALGASAAVANAGPEERRQVLAYTDYDQSDRSDGADRGWDRSLDSGWVNAYHGRRHGFRGRDGRIVNRAVFNTRLRARIVLIEEVVRTRRGPRLVCTVEARGPEAAYVSERRMRRIARNHCSPRARIRVFA